MMNRSEDGGDGLEGGAGGARYRSSVRVPVFGEVPLNVSEIVADLRCKDDPPLWAQFFKYVLFGLFSTFLFGLVWVMARVFFSDYISVDLPVDVRKAHMTVVMLVAFTVGATVAYITNRLYVFSASERHWTLEFLIFLVVSSLSFYAGNVAKDWFMDMGVCIDVAALSFAVCSAVVNFVARKYLVFG